MTNILIIDDHAMFRSGLHKVLQDVPEIGNVEETGEWREGLDRLEAGAVDLLLLDINLPDRSGLDLLGMIHSRFPALHIIVLSMYSEPQYALRALRNGAQGYVAKDMEVADLISAIRSVRRGRKFVTPSIAESLLGNMHSLASDPHAAHPPVRARIADPAHDRGRRFADRHRRAPVDQRQDRQHLPPAPAGEAGPGLQRPACAVRGV